MNTLTSFLPLILLVVFFFVARELFLWYWKINTIVKNQEKTNLLLKKYFDSKGISFSEDEKTRLNS